MRVMDDLDYGSDSDDGVQGEIGGHENDGDADSFSESLEKDDAEDAQQQKGDKHLAGEPGGRERVVDEVRGGVGRRQGHGDDEVCGRESEEDEDKDLATPFGKQALQHGDAALTVGTSL